ncbi:hypothetical protein CW735_09085 [Alteromonas sp. MB-3u-76]|uniref:hypothetical protein n=1 Tax=Alteromonas sp. MB-3u-76 TaxID=2058133 RepID=UPI000C30E36C|nr:hypothetical protein [Alteromonas sp. MB-3u-76]AUC88325.1 hypothetical protein CW735_09085 [Alteromonas sp. MB-3u-76]
MIDTIPSITQHPPRLNEESIENIYQRIAHFFPNLDDTGKKQFLSELFNVRCIDNCISDEYVFQNIEPAVDRAELNELAERIIGYTGYSLVEAKQVVRNVLNTIPKHLDDLIDYTTEARLKEFKESASLYLSVHAGSEKHLTTLKEIEDAFEHLPDVAITLFGNSQMDASRAINLDMIDAYTDRQKMLYWACDYYLNHRVGFKTNTMWLASFISSNSFGCMDGWLHRDGKLCNNRHFGFKDDDAVVDLIKSSLNYLDEYFERQLGYVGVGSEEATSFCRIGFMYIEAMLDAVEYLAKCREVADLAYKDIVDLLSEYSLLLNDRQELKLLTHEVAFDGVTSFTHRQFELLSDLVKEDFGTQGPPEDMYFYFDAWNFMAYASQYNINIMLGPLFLRSNYHGPSLTELSNFVAAQLKKGDLEEHWENMFIGYYTNYFFTLVNKNSHSHFLFDEILAALLDVRRFVDDTDVVRTMAELGHKPSQQAMSEYF